MTTTISSLDVPFAPDKTQSSSKKSHSPPKDSTPMSKSYSMLDLHLGLLSELGAFTQTGLNSRKTLLDANSESIAKASTRLDIFIQRIKDESHTPSTLSSIADIMNIFTAAKLIYDGAESFQNNHPFQGIVMMTTGAAQLTYKASSIYFGKPENDAINHSLLSVVSFLVNIGVSPTAHNVNDAILKFSQFSLQTATDVHQAAAQSKISDCTALKVEAESIVERAQARATNISDSFQKSIQSYNKGVEVIAEILREYNEVNTKSTRTK